jgi:DNA-binding response OmpR family regulator
MTTNRILIIDDDMTALDLMDILFERNDFDVVRHTDAAWIVEHIEELAPDIILIDLMMPRMNGNECIKLLRQKGVDIPVVVFTAAIDEQLHREAQLNGANLILSKPCKSDVLVAEIKRLLQLSGSQFATA